MKLTRDKIQRMVGSQGSMGSGSGGGGSIGITEQRVMEILQDYETVEDLETTLQDYVTNSALETTLADYATKTWVDQNYLSLSFFNALFQARTSQGAVVAPNSGDTTTIDNIKAMFGFWTDQYISALGQGSDGGGGGQGDVTWALLADNTDDRQIALSHLTSALTGYVTTSGLASTLASYVTTSALATTLADYVTATALATELADYVTTSALTTALADYVTTSALSTTLADYVTTSALATTLADYVTSTALSTTLADYATKTYVDQNYLSLSFFNALFQARTSQGAAVSPNAGDTSTIDNIKALFGFWTDQYISALGQGSDGGGGGQGDVTWALLADDTDTRQIALSHLTSALSGYATTSQLSSYLPLSGGTMTGSILASTNNAYNIGSSTAKFYYGYIHRLYGIQSIANSTDNAYVLVLPSKTGTIAVTSDIPSLSGYATESWVGNNYLPLSGGTLTTTTLPSSSGVLNISTTNSESAFGYSLIALSSSLQTNNRNAIAIGRSFDYYNSAILSYTNIGNASTSNYFSIGLWSVNDILCIVANGKVGIGKSAPTEKLDVDGSVLASSFKKSGGTSSQFLKADGSVDSNAYVTSSGVTSVATGTGLTGGTITSTGTISIDSTYQSYISHGESAYNSLSSYLPLSGGTMTGNIKLTKGSAALRFYNSSTLLGYVNWSDNSYGQYIELWNYQQSRGIWIGDMDTTAPIYFDGNQNKIWHSGMTSATMNAGSYPANTGALNVNATYADNWSYPIMCLASGQSSGQRVCFCLGKNFSQNNVAILNFYYSSSSSSSNYFSIGLHSQNDIITGNGAGNVGIGTGSPSYKLHVAGDIYATGGVTSLSDIRKKDVISYELPLSVEQIAAAPTIRFTWIDKREDGEQVGTIAQYWEKVLPESIKDKSGELSMSYGVASLISTIVTARKVVDHDRLLREQAEKISELENKCSFLEREVERLKCA